VSGSKDGGSVTASIKKRCDRNETVAKEIVENGKELGKGSKTDGLFF